MWVRPHGKNTRHFASSMKGLGLLLQGRGRTRSGVLMRCRSQRGMRRPAGLALRGAHADEKSIDLEPVWVVLGMGDG